MDPISIVIAALAAGASAGLTETVAGAIKDAYAGLKSVLLARFPQLDVSAVERMPDSEPKRSSLAEDLRHQVGDDGLAVEDPLVLAAQRLIEAVHTYAPSAGAAVGVDLDRVQANALKVHSVKSSGSGVVVTKSNFAGDIQISDVRAGGHNEDRR